jgi:hypothetical protein
MTPRDQTVAASRVLERLADRIRRQIEAEARIAELEARVLRVCCGSTLVCLLMVLLCVALRLSHV